MAQQWSSYFGLAKQNSPFSRMAHGPRQLSPGPCTPTCRTKSSSLSASGQFSGGGHDATGWLWSLAPPLPSNWPRALHRVASSRDNCFPPQTTHKCHAVKEESFVFIEIPLKPEMCLYSQLHRHRCCLCLYQGLSLPARHCLADVSVLITRPAEVARRPIPTLRALRATNERPLRAPPCIHSHLRTEAAFWPARLGGREREREISKISRTRRKLRIFNKSIEVAFVLALTNSKWTPSLSFQSPHRRPSIIRISLRRSCGTHRPRPL